MIFPIEWDQQSRHGLAKHPADRVSLTPHLVQLFIGISTVAMDAELPKQLPVPEAVCLLLSG
jgi:hypothetical protein